MLELALLGLLREAPVHGYELRKQLALRLGGLRAYSYGSLYPALRRLTRAGLIVEESAPRAMRARKVYRITAEGKERLDELLAKRARTRGTTRASASTSHFSGAPPRRRACGSSKAVSRAVEERREGMRFRAGQGGRTDRPLHRDQLQQLGLDACEREVRWLNELIENEKKETGP